MAEQTNQEHQSVILGILSSLKIPGNTRKVMVSNMLVMILPFCVLALSVDQLLKPTLVDIILNITSLQNEKLDSHIAKEGLATILTSVWLLLEHEMIFLVLFCFVTVLSLVIMVYITTWKIVNLKELVSRYTGTLKRLIITWLYTTFVVVFLVAIVLVSISVVTVSVTNIALIAMSIMIVVLCILCYLYLAAIWMLSVITSIMEEYLNGVTVLGRSEELIMGRRLQGFVLMLIVSLINVLVALALKTRKSVNQRTSRLETEIVVFCFIFMWKFFMSFLYMVFYYEYKLKNREQVEVEEGLGYVPVPAGYR